MTQIAPLGKHTAPPPQSEGKRTRIITTEDRISSTLQALDLTQSGYVPKKDISFSCYNVPESKKTYLFTNDIISDTSRYKTVRTGHLHFHQQKESTPVILAKTTIDEKTLQSTVNERFFINILNGQEGIAKYHDICTYTNKIGKEKVLIVMEKYPHDLSQLTTTLTHNEILGFAEDIAKVLSILKNNHIVHCDFKPKNLLVGHNGERRALYLFDFGISIWVDPEETLIEEILGPTKYMPPEYFKKENLGTPVDMWSAGIVLSEILGNTIYIQSKAETYVGLKDDIWKPILERMLDPNPDTRITPEDLILELKKLRDSFEVRSSSPCPT